MSHQSDVPEEGRPRRLSRRAALGAIAAASTLPWLAQNAQAQEQNTDQVVSLPIVTPLPRQQHTATPLGGGNILFAGGMYQGVLADVQIYRSDGSWVSAAPMNTPRYGHAAALLHYGHVLVVGGFYLSALADAEIYDPVANIWSPAKPLDIPRYFHTAVPVGGGEILIAGGQYQGILTAPELYTP